MGAKKKAMRFLGVGETCEDALAVPVQVADHSVDLGECEPHLREMLPVCDPQAKT